MDSQNVAGGWRSRIIYLEISDLPLAFQSKQCKDEVEAAGAVWHIEVSLLQCYKGNNYKQHLFVLMH